MSDAAARAIKSTENVPEPAPRRGIGTRIGSIFSSRPHHVNEFSIHLDQPSKLYGPGEVVQGKVILDVAKPLGVTHIVVRLSGFVEVFKNHKQKSSHPGEVGKTSNRRGKRWVSEYFGDGFASLFEDEIVVCGDGRLDPRPWHFEFKIAFPSQLNLPSSIQFERGQISYSITATLTRQATLTPATTTALNLRYQDKIDVASFATPKPREATLKPVVPPHSSKASIRRLTSSDKTSFRMSTAASTIRSQESRRPSVASSEAASSVNADESQRSSSSCQAESVVSSPLPSASTKSQSVEGPRVSIQLAKAACLGGQTVQLIVKVSNHYKRVQSMNGIIVTLYREGRTDFQPNLPVTSEPNGQGKYEDIYPRSRSGIGGMSLDNAGSDKKFQQELSQTIVPLIVDPFNMSAEARVAIRVPDDGVFPTLKGVPGNMISFRYFVEAVIDIQGKLFTHDRVFANAMAAKGSKAVLSDGTMPQEPVEGGQTIILAPNCINTSSIRQHKNAVRLRCELIIGTTDSTKPRAVQQEPGHQGPVARVGMQEQLPLHAVDGMAQHGVDSHDEHGWPARNGNGYGINYAQGSHYGPSSYDDYAYDPWQNGYYHDDYGYYEHDQRHQRYYSYGEANRPPPAFPGSRSNAEALEQVPLPSGMHDEGLSEKELIARHEAALLPSEPAGSSDPAHAPSAPPAFDEEFDEPASSSSFVRSENTTEAAQPRISPLDQLRSHSDTYKHLQAPVLPQAASSTTALDEQAARRQQHATEQNSSVPTDEATETTPSAPAEESKDEFG